jgi:anti-sigma B factor antagonist
MEAHTIPSLSHRFEIAVEETRSLPVVRVAGRLEQESASTLERVLRSLLRQGRFQIVLDCSRLTYLNSAAGRGLLRCQQEARDGGGDLKWAGLRDEALAILVLLQGKASLGSFQTCEEALTASTKKGKKEVAKVY